MQGTLIVAESKVKAFDIESGRKMPNREAASQVRSLYAPSYYPKIILLMACHLQCIADAPQRTRVILLRLHAFLGGVVSFRAIFLQRFRIDDLPYSVERGLLYQCYKSPTLGTGNFVTSLFRSSCRRDTLHSNAFCDSVV